jgi:hypothetical protein
VDTATDTVIDPAAVSDANPAVDPASAVGATSAQADKATSAPADKPVADKPAADASTSTESDDAEQADTPKRGRPRKQSTARKTRTVELILTDTGTAEGEWQAELTHSGKRVVQGLPIAAAAVSRAAKELHPDIFGGIETVINAAKQQHQAKLEELQAELDKVKQALAELED